MKVTVWAVHTDGDGFNETELFTSLEAALASVEKVVKEEWDAKMGGAPYPTDGDWEDAQQQMIDGGNSYLFCEISHHDLDLVELINATKSKPTEQAA